MCFPSHPPQMTRQERERLDRLQRLQAELPGLQQRHAQLNANITPYLRFYRTMTGQAFKFWELPEIEVELEPSPTSSGDVRMVALIGQVNRLRREIASMSQTIGAIQEAIKKEANGQNGGPAPPPTTTPQS